MKRIIYLSLAAVWLLTILISTQRLYGRTWDEYKVTFKASDMPLRLVLEKISHLYGIDILYADELVRGRFVSCNLIDVPLEAALEILLENTDIAFERVRENQFIFYDRKNLSRFTIIGNVVDYYSGESLPYANIRLDSSHLGTTSDKEGRFVLLDVPVKTCTLRTDYVGYQTAVSVVKPTNLIPNITIRLKPSIQQTVPIVVNAENWEFFKAEREPGRYSVAPVQFSDLPMIGAKDFFRSLQLIPGISANLNGTSGVNIRGSSPSENLMLVDGITLYHFDHSFGLLSALSSDIIKDIQLYKGGFPVRYGGRLAGVLDITTKNGDMNRFRARLSFNQLCGMATLEIPFAGRGALLLSGRKSYSQFLMNDLYRQLSVTSPYLPDSPPRWYQIDELKNPFGDEDFTNKNTIISLMDNRIEDILLNAPTSINFYDVLAKATVLPSNKDVVTVSALASDDSIHVSNSLDSLNLASQNNWNSQGASAKWYRQWNTFMETTLLASYSRYVKDYNFKQSFVYYDPANPSKPRIFHQNMYLGNSITGKTIELNGRFKTHSAVQWETGFQFTQTDIRYSESFSMSFEESKSYEQKESAGQNSFYIQNDWRINDQWQTVAGYRLVHYTLGKTFYHEPRLTVYYQAMPHLLIKAGGGITHQFALKIGENDQNTPYSVFWLLADNKEMEPSSSGFFTLGARWENNWAMLDVEAYSKSLGKMPELYYTFNEQDYELGLYPFNKQLIQKNFRVNGIDLLFKRKTGNPDFWIGYGYLRKEFVYDDYQNFISGTVKPEEEHSVKAVCNYNLGKFNFVLSYQFSSGKFYTAPYLKKKVLFNSELYVWADAFIVSPFVRNQERLPATHQLDLSINYHFNYSFIGGKVSLMLFNVLNRKNVWYKHFYIDDNGTLQNKNIYMFGFTPTLSLELTFN